MSVRIPRIDRSRYLVTPRCSGRLLLSLGRLLRKHTPPDPTPVLASCGEKLDIAVDSGSSAYADRIRSFGPSALAEDREDDGYTDSLLSIVRTRLEHWEVLARPTTGRLAADDEQAGVDDMDYEDLEIQAAQAKRIHTLLFSQGFNATQAPYPEEAEYLLALEKIIADEQILDDLIDLCGGPFVPMLRKSNIRYQAMVERRSARSRGGLDLREVNSRLQAAIQNYLLALLATIDDDDEENVAQVQRALDPVDALREQLARTGKSQGEGEGECRVLHRRRAGRGARGRRRADWLRRWRGRARLGDPARLTRARRSQQRDPVLEAGSRCCWLGRGVASASSGGCWVGLGVAKATSSASPLGLEVAKATSAANRVGARGGGSDVFGELVAVRRPESDLARLRLDVLRTQSDPFSATDRAKQSLARRSNEDRSRSESLWAPRSARRLSEAVACVTLERRSESLALALGTPISQTSERGWRLGDSFRQWIERSSRGWDGKMKTGEAIVSLG